MKLLVSVVFAVSLWMPFIGQAAVPTQFVLKGKVVKYDKTYVYLKTKKDTVRVQRSAIQNGKRLKSGQHVTAVVDFSDKLNDYMYIQFLKSRKK